MAPDLSSETDGKRYGDQNDHPAKEVPLDFSDALLMLKKGFKIARKGWNGSGMSLFVQRPGTHSKMTHPYLFMTIPDCEEGTRLLPWQPAQVDIFADDWEVVE